MPLYTPMEMLIKELIGVLTLDEFNELIYRMAVERHNGVHTRAAIELNVHIRTFQRNLKIWKYSRENFENEKRIRSLLDRRVQPRGRMSPATAALYDGSGSVG